MPYRLTAGDLKGGSWAPTAWGNSGRLHVWAHFSSKAGEPVALVR